MQLNIKKMYLIGFLKSLTFFGAIMIPFFLDWGKISYFQISILQSFFGFSVFLMEVPMGVIADKVGRKQSIGLGLLCWVIGLIVYTRIPNYYIFFLGELILSVGTALISGADTAIIYDTLKETKKEHRAKKIFSNYSIAKTLGIIVSLPVGSYLASLMIAPPPDNYPLVFSFTAIPMFIGFIIAFFLNEPKKITLEENYIQTAINGIKYFINHEKLRKLALNLTLISSTGFFMFVFYQIILRQLSIDIMYFGFVSAGFNIFSILLLNGVEFFEKKIGIKKLIFYTGFLPGLFYIFLVLTSNTFLTISLIFLIVGLKEMRRPIFEHHMNKFIESGKRATILSSISMIEKFSVAILYPLCGYLLDLSIKYTFIFIGTLMIIISLYFKVDEDTIF